MILLQGRYQSRVILKTMADFRGSVATIALSVHTHTHTENELTGRRKGESGGGENNHNALCTCRKMPKNKFSNKKILKANKFISQGHSSSQK